MPVGSNKFTYIRLTGFLCVSVYNQDYNFEWKIYKWRSGKDVSLFCSEQWSCLKAINLEKLKIRVINMIQLNQLM